MRNAYVIACCLLGAVAASWARALTAGTLSAVGATHLVWPAAIVGVLAALAGRHHLRAADDRDLSWGTLIGGALLIQLAATLALPLTSNDLWSNVAYGRMAAHGYNPYVVGPSVLPAGDAVRALIDPLWLDMPITYGPIITTVCAIAGRAGDMIGNLLAFKALMLAATLSSLWLAARLCRVQFGPAEARTRFVMFAWCPLLAWELAGQAHNDAILLLALLGFAWAATRERPLVAALCLAAGIASKFVAAPVAVFYLVATARSSLRRAVALALVMAAVCALVTLPWWHGSDTFGALWALLAPKNVRTTRSILDLISIASMPLGDGAHHVIYSVAAMVALLLSIAVAGIGCLRTRTVADAIHYAMLFLLCNDLVSLAWFQPWYITWLLPLALVHPDVRWLRLVVTYAALTLAAYVLPIDPVSNVAIDLYIGWRTVALVRASGGVWTSHRGDAARL